MQPARKRVVLPESGASKGMPAKAAPGLEGIMNNRVMEMDDCRYLKAMYDKAAMSRKFLEIAEERRIFEIYENASAARRGLAEKLDGARGGDGCGIRQGVKELEGTMQLATAVIISENEGKIRQTAAKMRLQQGALHLTVKDLIQAGRLSIVEKAMDAFDYRRGIRFWTYAEHWVKDFMRRLVSDTETGIRIPMHIFVGLKAISKAARLHWSRIGTEPTSQEISAATEISRKNVERYSEIQRASRTQPTVGLDGKEKIPEIPDRDSEKPDDLIARDEEGALVGRLLAILSERDRDIIRKRFGIGGFDERTRKEVAIEYGISRERVRQIEESGLAAMREAYAQYAGDLDVPGPKPDAGNDNGRPSGCREDDAA